MAATAAADRDVLAEEERRLAQAAAAGDGNAFATLYERYERRAYNLAYRIAGSEADAAEAVQDAFVGVLQRLPDLKGRELAFGSYVFTATRNASYDLIEQRRRARPSDSMPESSVPVGAGAGGLGLDPGDPDDDPSRRQLLAAQRDEIRKANSRLPERQREVLALRELEELPYDEIAAIMGMNRNSVAQLISRARLNLRSELRGAALESIAGSSPDCERALPLLARRDDDELGEAAEEAWLESHLDACDGCRLSREAMQEAGASYRAWAPIAAAPWLFKKTMARAAEAVGCDWGELTARRSAARADAGTLPGMPSLYLAHTEAAGARRRRLFVAAAALVVVLIAAGLVARESDDATRRPEPVLAEEAAAVAPGPKSPAGREGTRPPAAAPVPAQGPTPVTTGSAGGDPSTLPSRASDGTEPVAAEERAPKPSRESRSDPQPQPGPAAADPAPVSSPPPVGEPAVTEEPVAEDPAQQDPVDPPREPPPPRPEPEKPIRVPPPRTPPGSAPPGER